MERKTSRKVLQGLVVSAKSNKTISVQVDTYKTHPLYNKRYKSSRKYPTHDEKELAQVGDKVRIAETRPYSKTKRFRLVEILEKARG